MTVLAEEKIGTRRKEGRGGKRDEEEKPLAAHEIAYLPPSVKICISENVALI